MSSTQKDLERKPTTKATKPDLDDRETWRAVYWPKGHETDCLCSLCRIRRQHRELED